MKTNGLLVDKIVLITGASSGIGRAIAVRSAKLGARLILLGRDTSKLMDLYSILDGRGHYYKSLELTDFENLETQLTTIISEIGPIDGFVHSAGIDKIMPLKQTKYSLMRKVFDINVFAGFEISRILSKKGHLNEEGASFVFISSVMGRLGEPGKTAYCASKSALLAGVKAMALELSSRKIRCNCVLPGIVETEMSRHLFDNISDSSKEEVISNHPLGLGKPDDVAALVCFLLSNDSRWITGSDLIIDGGYSAR